MTLASPPSGPVTWIGRRVGFTVPESGGRFTVKAGPVEVVAQTWVVARAQVMRELQAEPGDVVVELSEWRDWPM